MIQSMILGGTSKILASTITYPYQVIKSRIQQRDLIPLKPDTSSSSLTTKTLIAKTAAGKISLATNEVVGETIHINSYNGTIDCIIKTWKYEGIIIIIIINIIIIITNHYHYYY